MHPRLALLGLLALTSGCFDQSSTFPRTQIVTNAQNIFLCCDDTASFPAKVGEFQVQIFEGQLGAIDPDTRTATFRSVIETGLEPLPGQHRVQSPVFLSVEDGAELDMGSTTVEVFINNCNFDTADIRVIAEIVGERIDDRQRVVVGINETFKVINTCAGEISIPSPPQLITETILGRTVDKETFDARQIEQPTGVETLNLASTELSPPNPIPPQVPTEDFTEIFAVGAVVVELDQAQLDAAFNDPQAPYAVQETDDLLVLDGGFQSRPMPEGEYLLAWQCVVEQLPFGPPPPKAHRIGFQFDRDLDPSNNANAGLLGAFLDRDTAIGTDTWYYAQYDFGFWRFEAYDASMGFGNPITTGARVIFTGQVQFLVVPLDEFQGIAPDIGVRFSTYFHEGDFATQGLPWSGDSSPPQGEDLIRFSTAPLFGN